MQANASHATPVTIDPDAFFMADSFEDDAETVILPALKKAASAAGRDHLLVRRRRRDSRRAAR